MLKCIAITTDPSNVFKIICIYLHLINWKLHCTSTHMHTYTCIALICMEIRQKRALPLSASRFPSLFLFCDFVLIIRVAS